MPDVTVKQLADVVGTPVDKLVEQLADAGIEKSGGDDVVTNDEKMQLLDSLRRSHGREEGAKDGPKKITLKRKRMGAVKLSGAGKKTVSVEVRGKRTYMKRPATVDEAPEQEAPEEPVVSEADLKAKEEELRMREEELKQKEEQAKAEAEALQRQQIEQSIREQAEAEARMAATEVTNQKAEEEMRRLKAEAEAAAKKQAEEAARQKAAEASKQDARGGKSRKSRGDSDATRYGRNELHVAKDKSGKRKKKGRTARRDTSLNLETRHVLRNRSTPLYAMSAYRKPSVSPSSQTRWQLRPLK